MSVWRDAFLVVTASSSLMFACGPASGEIDDGAEFGDVPQELVLENGLAPNGLGSNGLNSNGLNGNGLNSNGLSKLQTNAGFRTWLGCSGSQFDLRKKVMQYLGSCALPSGTSVTIKSSCNASITLQGGLGVAPDWLTSAPTIQDQMAVTSCLLARVNAKAQHVTVSFRQAHVYVSASEDDSYPYLEGAFFGNLFASTPRKFSCKGDYANVGNGRSCTKDPASCGFTAAGLCDSVCTSWSYEQSGAKRWAHCQAAGDTFGPMTVALKTKDTTL